MARSACGRDLFSAYLNRVSEGAFTAGVRSAANPREAGGFARTVVELGPVNNPRPAEAALRGIRYPPPSVSMIPLRTDEPLSLEYRHPSAEVTTGKALGMLGACGETDPELQRMTWDVTPSRRTRDCRVR